MQQSDILNYLVIGAVVVLGAAVVFSACRPRDPNLELARTARTAVEMARDAQVADRSAVLWSGRLRLLAVAVGVSVPLVVALLIWRTSTQREVDAAEAIEAAEQYLLPGPIAPPHEALPSKPTGALPAEATGEPSD
jgi:hypothetical protein